LADLSQFRNPKAWNNFIVAAMLLRSAAPVNGMALAVPVSCSLKPIKSNRRPVMERNHLEHPLARTQSQFAKTNPNPPAKIRTLADRCDWETEDMLREMAFVLFLTGLVKKSLTDTPKADPKSDKHDPERMLALCG
jgi:hypothetical protein